LRRRVISIGSVLVAVAALALVLYNATLVDRRAPTIERVSLSATANGDPGLAQTVTAIDIEFSEPVDQGSVERRFRIAPYVAGTLTWNRSSVIFSPSAKLPQDTEFRVFVDPGFVDLAGNAASAGLEAWAFRTVGLPQVLTVDPPAAADGIAVDAPVTITFDRLMDTSAVEAAIDVAPDVPFRAAWSGQAVTLTFDRPLAFGTDYTLRVGTDASDTDGNRLGAAFESAFSTVNAGLGIRAIVPAAGVAGVSVRTPIAIVFDGPIEPSTVQNAIQITPPVDGDLALVSEIDDREPRPSPDVGEADPTVLVFRPTQPLAAHTTYTVTLEDVVAPLGAPDEVAAGRTWTFTTGQPATSGQNQIAFFSDRSGVRNVWLMNPDGSNARQLTTELVPVASFDVTTDGAQVAWSAGGVVKVMGIAGTDERTLTSDGRFEYGARFTPDGRSLLVARRDAAGQDLGLWLVPLDATAGDEQQVLPTGAPPLGSVELGGEVVDTEGQPVWAARTAFSGDGQAIAATLADGSVWLLDLATPAGPGLDTGIVASSAPAWSASDGEFLVVGRRDGEAIDGLYALRPAESEAVMRYFDAAGSVATTGEGRVAVLVREGDITRVATTFAGAGAGPRVLTNDDGLVDRWPAFAPDGRSVLFGRLSSGAAATSQGIWSIDIATGALARLTTDGAYPRWLP
jgi:hypothetical protein